MAAARSTLAAPLLILLLLALDHPAQARTSQGSCNSVLGTLGPCLTSVLGSKPPAPSRACCAAVHAVAPRLVCRCLLGVARKLKGVNFSAARSIPSKCHASASFKCI
ncbi:non-specific lipid-transfer protein 1-like [Selaginella moellendorffii]|uniref:non-specific lipid-transfer protein 1-like n=1 Tax=Selaginella moellendorffii TaxID=88036 RepID=UPI000D1C9D8E|nr:non-specific lipid-transfer protein 1-like [Selaginella moellendorffii]|eukprot:XP_024535255.1 non-specific lipid-transfer protein 1-like [Selaginella moellendorffii]